MKNLLNHKYSYAALAVILFVLALFTDKQLSAPDYSSAALEFQTVLHKKEKKLNVLLDDIAQQLDTTDYRGVLSKNARYFSELYDNEGIIILIYDNDTLRFWSDNAAPVQHILSAPYEDGPELGIEEGLIHLKNGWYESIPKTHGGKTVIGLILIKNDYPYQNQYLTNNFQSRFLEINLPPGCKLINAKTESADTYPINSTNGNYLCSLKFENNQSSYGIVYLSSGTAFYFALLLYVLSFIFLSG